MFLLLIGILFVAASFIDSCKKLTLLLAAVSVLLCFLFPDSAYSDSLNVESGSAGLTLFYSSVGVCLGIVFIFTMLGYVRLKFSALFAFIIILVSALFPNDSLADNYPGNSFYGEIGAGYKMQEADLGYYSSPYTAHFAIGYNWDSVRLEISHDSQWFTGWPVDKRPEYHITEIRVVKVFNISEMFK